MPDSAAPIVVDYYSDVLCVWAWIAQPRLEELQRQWSDKIVLRHRFVDIFGDAHTKIPSAWGPQDCWQKFHNHAGGAHQHSSINANVWTKTRPHSSMQTHLVLRAVELAGGDLPAMALRVRQAFFVEAADISDLQVLLSLAVSMGIDRRDIEDTLHNGSAMARLSSDLRHAKAHGIKGSPTWVLNEGRQVLYGNVGYRILNANIEELAKAPSDEASWC